VLVATSKGMQAVKLCTNKILQFLTEGKTVAVVVVVVAVVV